MAKVARDLLDSTVGVVSGIKMRFVVLLAFAAGSSSVCQADPAEIQRCRLIPDSSARLKCYDAIPLPAAKAEAEGRNKAGETPRASSSSASDTAAAVGAKADPAAQFGLESRRQPSAAPESIESAIAGRFEGWVSTSRIRLANGQVWEIRDGSQAAYDLRDPKVRIVRGISGSFFMEIEGISQTPRVRRLQ